MSAAFTPGPWSYEPKIPGSTTWFRIVGHRQEDHAEVDIGDIRGGTPTAEANARLIAEAPDLYAWLDTILGEEVLFAWANEKGIGREEYGRRSALINNSRDALAKARGEQ